MILQTRAGSEGTKVSGFLRWAAPAAVFLVSLQAYCNTLTRWHTYDAIAYAGQISQYVETGKHGWLCHPHHLLFNPLGFLVWRALLAVGLQVDPLRSLQYMNAFFGAMGLALVYYTLRTGGLRPDHIGKRSQLVNPFVSLAAVTTLGAGFGYWSCATDGRVNMPGLVAVTLTIGLSWGMLETPSIKQCLGLLSATLLAILLHQSHGMLAIAALGAIALAPTSRRDRTKYAFIYIGGVIAGVMTVYLGISLWIKGFSSTAEILDWALAYAQDGRWWSFSFAQNITLSGKAIVHAFVTALPGNSEGPVGQLTTELLSPLRLIAACAAGFGLAYFIQMPVQLVRSMADDDRRAFYSRFAILGLVGAPYAVFFTIWNPGYFVFWLPVALVLVMSLALMTTHWRLTRQTIFASGLLLWAVAATYANLSATILRRTAWEHNPYLVICGELNKIAREDDIALLTGVGDIAVAETYIPYFTYLSLRSLNTELKRAGNDDAEAVKSLREEIRETTRDGRQVIILDEFINPTIWKELARVHSTPADVPSRVIAGYSMEPLFQLEGSKAFRLVPLRTAANTGNVSKRRL